MDIKDKIHYQIQNQLVIYTRYRSGSSFVGEIFKQHPDVFYTFDPIHCFRKTVRTVIWSDLTMYRMCSFHGY